MENKAMNEKELFEAIKNKRQELRECWNEQVIGKGYGDISNRDYMFLLELHQDFLSQLWAVFEELLRLKRCDGE